MEATRCDKYSHGFENQGRTKTVECARSHRRPLRQVNEPASEGSPGKRRKGSDGILDSIPPADDVVGRLRQPIFAAPETVALRLVDQHPSSTLHEVFSRLKSKDVIQAVAPACKAWRDAAHGDEFWAMMRRRNVRLVDQLVIVDKLVERRAKGKLFRCRQLGTGKGVLLRVVNLELTNAGVDDGVPTSFLREAALLRSLQHPNIIKFFGAEIRGAQAFTSTEYVAESLAAWQSRLERWPRRERTSEVRLKFSQLLTGVSHLHSRGLMHRNIKPDNVFLDQRGVVKLGDFTTSRMLDLPLQAYTPEDPKERDCSGREMRRLWYRAPEMLLRDDVYCPKVDVWSVGCLLVEAATGKPLFPSESEVDHLFRIFRHLGTPTVATWPEIVSMKNFSPKFPLYPALDLAQVTRATCRSSSADQVCLTALSSPDRCDVLQRLVDMASSLGLEGMSVLDTMLKLRPADRASANDALASPFFAEAGHSNSASGQGRGAELHPTTARWIRGESPPSIAVCDPGFVDGIRPGIRGSCPEMAAQPGLMSPDMAWSILRVMQLEEHANMAATCMDVAKNTACVSHGCPRLPPMFDASNRASLIDHVIQLANTLQLTDRALHLSICLVDKALSLEVCSAETSRVRLLGAACLKIADAFAEHSNEYYKRESATEYVEAMRNHNSAQELILCEKELLTKLDFDVSSPNSNWFIRSFLAYARFTSTGAIAKIALFIGDLMLLDYDVLKYAPSLRAQCALVLAAFLASEAGQSSGASGGRAASLSTRLQRWDEGVRDYVCQRNTAVEVTMCLGEVVRILVERRREWKTAGLTGVEERHKAVVQGLVYPEAFAVSDLAGHLLAQPSP